MQEGFAYRGGVIKILAYVEAREHMGMPTLDNHMDNHMERRRQY